MTQPDIFCSQCPSRVIVELLAGKWSVLVIHSLVESPKRTSELRRHIGGISEKMLIQTLRNLEKYGFVSRYAHAQVPPRVDYSLTPLGLRLASLVRALNDWVEDNCAEILAAAEAFDPDPNG